MASRDCWAEALTRGMRRAESACLDWADRSWARYKIRMALMCKDREARRVSSRGSGGKFTVEDVRVWSSARAPMALSQSLRGSSPRFPVSKNLAHEAVARAMLRVIERWRRVYAIKATAVVRSFIGIFEAWKIVRYFGQVYMKRVTMVGVIEWYLERG